jgi:hypothetical protein
MVKGNLAAEQKTEGAAPTPARPTGMPDMPGMPGM